MHLETLTLDKAKAKRATYQHVDLNDPTIFLMRRNDTGTLVVLLFGVEAAQGRGAETKFSCVFEGLPPLSVHDHPALGLILKLRPSAQQLRLSFSPQITKALMAAEVLALLVAPPPESQLPDHQLQDYLLHALEQGCILVDLTDDDLAPWLRTIGTAILALDDYMQKMRLVDPSVVH